MSMFGQALDPEEKKKQTKRLAEAVERESNRARERYHFAVSQLNSMSEEGIKAVFLILESLTKEEDEKELRAAVNKWAGVVRGMLNSGRIRGADQFIMTINDLFPHFAEEDKVIMSELLEDGVNPITSQQGGNYL